MTVTAPYEPLPPDLVARLRNLPGDGRRLIAVAGAPASGKSVLGAALRDALRRDGVCAELVPMDGFHLDNRILDARCLRARKGAPETFDAAGFIALVQRLRSDAEVVYPLFDRAGSGNSGRRDHSAHLRDCCHRGELSAVRCQTLVETGRALGFLDLAGHTGRDAPATLHRALVDLWAFARGGAAARARQ